MNTQLFIDSPSKSVLTEKGIINALKGMTEQRARAVGMYPSSRTFQESSRLISLLRCELSLAEAELNYKSAVKICLRLESAFLYLAPRSTVKIFESYKQKLDFLMDACRIILNYQKQ